MPGSDTNGKPRSEHELSILGPLLHPDWETLPQAEQQTLISLHDAALALVDLKRIIPSERRSLPDSEQMQDYAKAQLIEAMVRHAMKASDTRRIAALPFAASHALAKKGLRTPEEIEVLGVLLTGDAKTWENLSPDERTALVARHDNVLRICATLENMQPGTEMARLAASGTTAAERIIAKEKEERLKEAMAIKQSGEHTPMQAGSYLESLFNLPPERDSRKR